MNVKCERTQGNGNNAPTIVNFFNIKISTMIVVMALLPFDLFHFFHVKCNKYIDTFSKSKDVLINGNCFAQRLLLRQYNAMFQNILMAIS